MAICYRGATLGIAVYDRLVNEISILQCQDEVKGPLAYQMLRLAKMQVSPQLLLLSCKAEAQLVEAAQEALPSVDAGAPSGDDAEGEGGTGALRGGEFEVRLERGGAFAPDKARQRVEAQLVLRAAQQPHASSLRAALAAAVDLGAEQQMAALGALVGFVVKEGLAARSGYPDAEEEEQAEPGGVLVVERVRQLSMNGLLHVDLLSLHALQIFAHERHPSAMGLGRAKEGFSLFALAAGRAATQAGKRLLRLWFLRPVVNLEVIADRADTIGLLVARPDMIKALRAEVRKVPDMGALLNRLAGAQQRPDVKAMQQVQVCLEQLLRLRAIFGQLAPELHQQLQREERQQQQQQQQDRDAQDEQEGQQQELYGGAELGAAYAQGGMDLERRHHPGGSSSSWLHGAAAQPQPPHQHHQHPAAAGRAHPARPLFASPGGSTSHQAPSSTMAAAGRAHTLPPAHVHAHRRAYEGHGGHPAGAQRPWGGGAYGSGAQTPDPTSLGRAPPRGGTARHGAGGGVSAGGPRGAHRSGGAAADEGGAAAEGAPPTSWSTVSISAKLLTLIGDELQEAQSLLLNVLDCNQATDGLMVAEGVCPELDQLKATYQQLPEHLTQVVEAELRRVPRYLVRHNSAQLWSILYLPQVGFLMRVQGQQLSADLLDALPDYELAFEGSAQEGAEGGGSGEGGGGGGAGWAAYYRTDATRRLNEQYGDMQYKIQDLEATLVAELAGRLLGRHGASLQRCGAAVAELDCLLALGGMAAAGGPGGRPYCRPVVTEYNVLRIVNGRHPLAETVVESYIPFSTAMEEGGSRLQVVSGPNTSGKSCYARAVALITFLAHIGAWVPAEAAEVGLADRIAARSAVTGDSVVLGQSAFMADLAQVSSMLQGATSRSLLVLDEFGKGTLASDGVGLTASLLHHMAAGAGGGGQPAGHHQQGADRDRGGGEGRGAASAGAPASDRAAPLPGAAPAPGGPRGGVGGSWGGGAGVGAGAAPSSHPPPRLILCTHFHELFRPGILPASPHIVFLQMEVLTLAPPHPAQPRGGAGAAAAAARQARGHPGDGGQQQQQQQQQQAAPAAGGDAAEHVFLYRLVPGQCPASFGVHCARLAGVGEEVCRRAQAVIDAQQRGVVLGRSARVLEAMGVRRDLLRLQQLQDCAAADEGVRRDQLLACLEGWSGQAQDGGG